MVPSFSDAGSAKGFFFFSRSAANRAFGLAVSTTDVAGRSLLGLNLVGIT